jgi:hypothetical protein
MPKGGQMDYRIKTGQSIYDLSIIYGYGIEGVVSFLKKSPQLGSLDKVNLGGINIDVTKINTPLTDYLNLYATGISSSISLDGDVFATEDLNEIFISEDGSKEFTPES